ncbi:MAG TPA: hypothetical protein VFA45_12140 [Actinomycetes bacterium]|jgi:hypothetical protein|nr:hypothetical protein [Actinomycetes bacterium]
MLEGVVVDDTELFNDKLQEWEDFYNFYRPHGALGDQTPYEWRERRRGPRRERTPSAAQLAPASIAVWSSCVVSSVGDIRT